MRGGIHNGLLILVNAEHPIQHMERPVLAPAVPGSDILLDTRAAAMLSGVISRIGAAGEIVPVSGWRSEAEQREIWDGSMRDSGEEFTRKYVALPGCSEHQTGLAIDLALRADNIDFIRTTARQSRSSPTTASAAASAPLRRTTALSSAIRAARRE